MNKNAAKIPLAERMRPKSLSEVVGHAHLLGEDGVLARMVAAGKMHSMILWGPPGTGKTTLADILSRSVNAEMIKLSAVMVGVREIRAVIKAAELNQQAGLATVLFVDEIHRFNKSQQDAFLPHMESGLITLIGATTENPSFELNNALLSRSKVYVLGSLTEEDLQSLIERALIDSKQGLGLHALSVDADALKLLVRCADGDARLCMGWLESAAECLVFSDNPTSVITVPVVEGVIGETRRRFDNGGDEFYHQISALHKSVRGSDPDAALYWLARMMDGGCDVKYLLRRIIRMASEDIGNADPRALQIATNAASAYERLGSPEGDLSVAQAVVYLACAAKSNAVYTAWNAARSDVKRVGSQPVPDHLRNAPTKLNKQLGYSAQYRYSHDEPNAFSKGQTYFPDKMVRRVYYEPVERGLEIKIKQKLTLLRE